MTTPTPQPEPVNAEAPRVTGTPEGHLMQDVSRDLTRWLANKPDAMLHAREAAAAIGAQVLHEPVNAQMLAALHEARFIVNDDRHTFAECNAKPQLADGDDPDDFVSIGGAFFAQHEADVVATYDRTLAKIDAAIAAAEAAQTEALCMCKDRPLSGCPGEWEPGCDLGNNGNYVRATQPWHAAEAAQAQPAAAVPAPAVPIRAVAEPMFWVRLTSDGCYEGPIHNDGIERVRKLSGAWHPLYLGAQPAATAPTAPEGFKSVPVQPTPKMLAAMWEVRDSHIGQSENTIAAAAYAAMLAAAPAAPLAQPQQPQQGEGA